MSFYVQIGTTQKFSEIFDLEIVQKEGELSTAKIKVQNNFDVVNIYQKHISIMYNDEILFSGKPLQLPNYIDDRFMYLQFIAQSDNKFQQLIDAFHESKNYNKLFDNKVCDVKEITEAIPARVYFNRKDGSVKISNIIDNSYKYEIKQDSYWADSITCREPISKVNVKVVAQWIQKSEGMIDLFPMIASKFQTGLINSFNNLRKQWYKLSQSLPRSCYSVICSDIHEIYPTNMPMYSCKFKADEKTIQFKRFWFDGILNIGWNYKQKIEETVNFSIKNSTVDNSLEKNIEFILGEIDLKKDNTQSFFSTSEGHAALTTAAQRAFNHMLSAQRNVEISICGDFNQLHHITVDDSILIHNKYLPGGSIIGKVIYTFIKVSENKKYVKLKIAACQHAINLDSDNLSDFFKTHIIVDKTDKVSSDNIVEDIIINNPPEFQINTLLHNPASSIKELKHNLIAVPTTIKIQLKNLNTTKCDRREININQAIIVY